MTFMNTGTKLEGGLGYTEGAHGSGMGIGFYMWKERMDIAAQFGCGVARKGYASERHAHRTRVFVLCIISACRCLDTRVGGILGHVRSTGIRLEYCL
jgi:hypothetical protein